MSQDIADDNDEMPAALEAGKKETAEASGQFERIKSRPSTSNSWVGGNLTDEAQNPTGDGATGVQVFHVVSDDSESEHMDAPSPPPPDNDEPLGGGQRRPFPSLADLVDSGSDASDKEMEPPSPPSSAASSEGSFMHRMEESRMYAGVHPGEFDEQGAAGSGYADSTILERLQQLKLRETQLEAKIREKRKRARKAQEEAEKKEEEGTAALSDEPAPLHHDQADQLDDAPSPDPDLVVPVHKVSAKESYLKSLQLKEKVEYDKMVKRWPKIRSSFLLIFYDAVYKTKALRKLRKQRLAEMFWYIIFVTIISLCIIQARSYMQIFNAVDTLKQSMWTLSNFTDMLVIVSKLQSSVLFQNVSDMKNPGTMKLKLKSNVVGNNLIAGDVQLRQWKVPLHSCKIPEFVSEVGVCFPEYTKANQEIRTMPPGQYPWTLDPDGLVPSWGYWLGGGGDSYIPLESFLARVYDQGAYTADLNSSHDDVGALFGELKANRWLDHNSTRMVRLEFNFYNPNVELWFAAMIQWEARNRCPCSPCLTCEPQVSQTGSIVNYFRTGIFVTMVVLVAIYTGIQVVHISELKIKYLYDFYNVLTILNLVIFYIVIVREVSTRIAANRINNGPISSQPQELSYSIQLINYWTAFNAMLLWIKLAKFTDVVRVGKVHGREVLILQQMSARVAAYSAAFQHTCWDVVAVMIAYGMLFGGFAISFHVYLGQDMREFQDMKTAAYSMWTMATGLGPYSSDFYRTQNAAGIEEAKRRGG
ncbi:hypothetical protein GUITHDRAFT_115878 [Guillardia theta CCMP2712]|uniref:Polycystin domain-containing protein n=1 Tax=Guillardia theta (strain CCMP2712) TaxID=905079 RepID=L1IPT8_GUITC|nr:hypothetical protein GUITHDRAFT_115878 [Guillardia theta CCMP2712]EKX37904.1 hypothetical protein GUITHDRAFT_115878 [Guillardia theta CCMP2712]|eukprot:XP_005824884.1 hypothetical protein GUITHDRAFT_115878 [Guillardia theta CCMP2712]